MTRTKREILKDVKRLAIEYYELTARPLGVTGEIAEVEAAERLGLKLVPARTQGYDALRHDGNDKTRIQIKGRCILKGRPLYQGRVSKIDLSKLQRPTAGRMLERRVVREPRRSRGLDRAVPAALQRAPTASHGFSRARKAAGT